MRNWLAEDKGEYLLKKILDGAPSLENVIHDGDPRIMCIIPENKYRLLSTIDFDDSDANEGRLNLIRNRVGIMTVILLF